MLGLEEGSTVGDPEGTLLGTQLGALEGAPVGTALGRITVEGGFTVGPETVGLEVIEAEGETEEDAEGDEDTDVAERFTSEYGWYAATPAPYTDTQASRDGVQ